MNPVAMKIHAAKRGNPQADAYALEKEIVEAKD
jgi:hypothetical protein